MDIQTIMTHFHFKFCMFVEKEFTCQHVVIFSENTNMIITNYFLLINVFSKWQNLGIVL